MASRREARRLALDVLYQADVSDLRPSEVLEQREAVGEPVAGFGRELVLGVEARLSEIDALLGEYARDWTVPRMAAVDRAALRIACYELLFSEDVPTSVAIAEAVDAVKKLSTDESGAFVNGILGEIARTKL